MTFWEDSLIFIVLITYLVISYLFVRFLCRLFLSLNFWLQLLIKSFLFALFFGIGISGSDGEPGFGILAPNILAIPLMFIQGFYSGVLSGLVILLFWWIIIFLFMLITYIFKKRKRLINN